MIAARNTERGFTLVELMVALVLGLLLTGVVVSIFIANRETFRTAENMARLLENARFAFEMLSREVRESGGNPCGAKAVANVLNDNREWWRWGNGSLMGYDDNQPGPKTFGSGSGERVNGTDGILILSASLLEGVVITDHDPTAAKFKVNKQNHGINDGDIVMACDDRSAAIFQVTNSNQNNRTIVHNTGGSVSPGNCSKGLGYPTVCTPNGTPKTFANGGFIAKYHASFWYIGNNPRGGRSLYRLGFAGNPSVQTDEIAEGVTDMQIEYLTSTSGTTQTLANSYVAASSIPDWSKVVAVRITLTLETQERVGTSGSAIRRTFKHVVGLRNREPAS